MTGGLEPNRQYIRAKIMQFGESFIEQGKDPKSFCPVHISTAYELDYMAVYEELLRLVDSRVLRRTKNGRYFWL